MAMLITPRAISEMAKMATLAIMATIVIAYSNFCMAWRDFQLNSMNININIFVILSFLWHFYNVKILIRQIL